MASKKKTVEAFKHDDAKRKNIPSVEQQSFVQQDTQGPKKVRYPRNTDLDPQLVWRGKDEQDWSDLVVNAPPLYIQEKVHPKALVDDLLRQSRESEHQAGMLTPDLFSDFNGIPKGADKTEFYTHDQNWTNRMILGDSLQVMASLAEREGLRGTVQCIYFDPPYGIKFNSNFQWSTTSRDVKDGDRDHITREPEMVKAFRDTWRDGIHSYLTYLRDRLTVARDLLSDSGSLFLQIGDENIHRVRSLADEIFGEDNFVSQIAFKKSGTQSSDLLPSNFDFIAWYAKNRKRVKYRKLGVPKAETGALIGQDVWQEGPDGVASRCVDPSVRNDGRKFFTHRQVSSPGASTKGEPPFIFQGVKLYPPAGRHWSISPDSLERVAKTNRFFMIGKSLRAKDYIEPNSVSPLGNIWTDTSRSGFGEPLRYVVETATKVVERCLLMATDPGDLVLDPTCGSGTTATVSEHLGRRWITIDTSRVALALARCRLMGAKYPYFYLLDSPEGKAKDAEILRVAPSTTPSYSNIRHGFVYERVPRTTLKSIANNVEIDVIWDLWKDRLAPLLERINAILHQSWKEWEVPRNTGEGWPDNAKVLHAAWWDARIKRQAEIDASVASRAEFEYLYDKPYEDKKRVRVAGPFTVESLSPHRTLGVDENDELIVKVGDNQGEYGAKQTFEQMILENLKSAGVQQAHKEDRIKFTSLTPWPGTLVCAEGRFFEGLEEAGQERRAAIFIGPEFGTVQRADLVAATREAGDAGFDALIACAFNYEAHATEFSKLGRIPVLKARMNADLHMAEDLKNTGKGNLFVIFGEPDMTILPEDDGRIRVKVNGVDVFKPQTGEVVSDGADGIACWFIDTDYNEESFFVRHAYFLGANDPYSSLKTTLKAEINADAWSTLNSDTSRPFEKPKSGRFAVKVINHLGDEVMKVFKV